jgi:molybdenum cofactor cytidylyltransferase/nicotine blue oxidoreductase
MGRPKAELVVGGVRLLDRAVAVLRDAGCDPVIAIVREGTNVAGANAVVNPDPDRGMRSSLELAIDAGGGSDALAVLLVDTPGVGPDAVREVIAAWRPGRIAVGRFPGKRRGHPVVMDRALWREAIALAQPDAGARVLMWIKPYLVDEVRVSGDATDLDTPEDVTAWTASGHLRAEWSAITDHSRDK